MSRKVWYADLPLNQWPVEELENTLAVIYQRRQSYTSDEAWRTVVMEWEQALAEARAKE